MIYHGESWVAGPSLTRHEEAQVRYSDLVDERCDALELEYDERFPSDVAKAAAAWLACEQADDTLESDALHRLMHRYARRFEHMSDSVRAFREWKEGAFTLGAIGITEALEDEAWARRRAARRVLPFTTRVKQWFTGVAA